ncbi:MAG: glycosyltransferase family 2 protein [Fibromonadaceae bacterium]|jgi:glycosyltransferase involved in cell wall biosynthesis|nr:glycosyltransferase family 2 protein [Fibromonadaceae bacterium]
MANLILAIVVPCYNEKEVLPETAKQLLGIVQRLIDSKVISSESKICFVDDGSRDNTWEIIENLCAESKNFTGIKLSKNRGHQNALLCGLLSAREYADVSISMDADLQDDISVVDEMLQLYGSGCEIVYGVRSNRAKDSFFKRATAHAFYRFMNLLGAKIIYNHADYRLMSKQALNALAEYREVNLFLRGIVPMLGFKTGIAYYERKERLAGESKYPFHKMLKFAVEGITSLSTKPIRIITVLGIAIFVISLGMMVYSFFQYFYSDTVPGWSSLICSIWSLCGLILFSIGVVGEYVGKIYLETKQRPRFAVEKIV